jgi:quercetin dioxygenase-like cupin family protein
MMQKAEFPGDQYASMLVAVSIAPSGKVPLHTHPGIEMSYLMDGDAELYVEGSPDRHVTAGDSFQIPAGVPHRIDNLNPDKPLKLVTTYVVEKDKPLVTLVQK